MRVDTTEKAEKEANKYGWTLLEVYQQGKPLLVMCHEGHSQELYPHRFKSAKCKSCSLMKKALSVKEEVEAKGYVLNNKYKGWDRQLSLTCPNGHGRTCTIESFRKYECELCQNEAKLKNLLSKIKSLGYTICCYPEDSRSVMTAYCINGHKRKAKVHNFLMHNCIECEKGRPANYDINFCRQAFENKGFILLDDSYINCKTEMSYICSCGRKGYKTLDNVLNSRVGIHCNYCKGEYISGESHPNWNPELNDEEREIRRNYPEYVKWRSEVYRRDRYTCQCCGEHGGMLNAHHIYNYSQYKDLRTNIDNGITLCEICHKDFHNIYSYRDNDEIQLYEYIEEIKNEYAKLNNTW